MRVKAGSCLRIPLTCIIRKTWWKAMSWRNMRRNFLLWETRSVSWSQFFTNDRFVIGTLKYIYNRKARNVWRTGRYSSCLLHVFLNLAYNIGRFAFRDGSLWHKKDATAAYMRLWHSSFMNTDAWMEASAKSAKVRMNYAKYWIVCRRQNWKIMKKRKKNKKT